MCENWHQEKQRQVARPVKILTPDNNKTCYELWCHLINR